MQQKFTLAYSAGRDYEKILGKLELLQALKNQGQGKVSGNNVRKNAGEPIGRENRCHRSD